MELPELRRKPVPFREVCHYTAEHHIVEIRAVEAIEIGHGNWVNVCGPCSEDYRQRLAWVVSRQEQADTDSEPTLSPLTGFDHYLLNRYRGKED